MRRVLLAIIMVPIVAGRGYAQSSDSSAIAEQLFNQARDLVKANQWAEACPKFEASLHYDPVLGTRLNLAACYEHIGKLATAWGIYRESIELAKKAGDVKRRDYAQKQAAALEPRLPKLSISVPAKLPAGFIVKRDATLVDTGALGVALYIDPGSHEIIASAPGFEAFKQTVTVVEGNARTLAIPELNAASVLALGSSGPPIEEHVARAKPGTAPSHARRYIAIGGGLAGVAAVGVSLLFGVKANSDFNDAKRLCGASLVCDSTNYERGIQLMRDAHSHATASTAFAATGGAAIVASAVILLAAQHSPERTAAQIIPVTRDHGVGLAITGRF